MLDIEATRQKVMLTSNAPQWLLESFLEALDELEKTRKIQLRKRVHRPIISEDF